MQKLLYLTMGLITMTANIILTVNIIKSNKVSKQKEIQKNSKVITFQFNSKVQSEVQTTEILNLVEDTVLLKQE